MRFRPLVCALLLATAALTFGAPGVVASRQLPLPADNGTLFTGARLIVGDGTVIEDSALLIQGDKIAAVGRRIAFATRTGVRHVDLTGKTVMPALINAHAHLGYEKFASREAGNFTRENVVSHLNRFAYYGIGAVLSLGTDPIDFAVPFQRDQQAGKIGGARYLWAAGIAPTGGGPGSMLPLVRATGAVAQVGSPDEGRAAVRSAVAKGATLIKIWVDDRGGTQPKLQPPVYQAIVDEAHKLGVRVMAHPATGEDAKGLLRAGVDGLAHMREVDDDFITLMTARHVFMTPGLWSANPATPTWYKDPFLQDTFSPAVAQSVNQRLAEAQAAIVPTASEAARRARAEGFAKVLRAHVRVILGTDAGAIRDRFYGFTDHLELQEWVRMGMTPAEAITAATQATAEAMRLTDMGTIAAGKSADFIVLDANPLDDIVNTRRISRVYLRGQAIDRDALRAGWASGSN